LCFGGIKSFYFEYENKKTCQRFIYSPNDAQVNCFKNNIKVYIKINIETAPTYFGAVTPSPGSALLLLDQVKVVKIAN